MSEPPLQDARSATVMIGEGISLLLTAQCQGHVYSIVCTVDVSDLYSFFHVPPVGIWEGISLVVPSKTGSRLLHCMHCLSTIILSARRKIGKSRISYEMWGLHKSNGNKFYMKTSNHSPYIALLVGWKQWMMSSLLCKTFILLFLCNPYISSHFLRKCFNYSIIENKVKNVQRARLSGQQSHIRATSL